MRAAAIIGQRKLQVAACVLLGALAVAAGAAWAAPPKAADLEAELVCPVCGLKWDEPKRKSE